MNSTHSKSTSRLGQSGFSLAETLIQLTILVIVTVPMIMILNIQKQGITTTQESTVNRVLTDQLFDNILPLSADPITDYQIAFYTGSGNTQYHYAIACDPASKFKSPTQYTATCPGTGGGSEEMKGPFFKRALSYVGSNDRLRVTIQLFREQRHTAGAETPYYEVSREYDLNAYRLRMGSTDTNPNAPARNFDTDSTGKQWYGESTIFTNMNALGANDHNNLYFVTLATGCPAANYTKQTPADANLLTIPFKNYRQIQCNQGVHYNFKATPNTTYDVRFYYLLPKNENLSFNCVSNAPTISCALASMEIVSLGANHTVGPNLFTQSMYDINAATGLSTNSSSPVNISSKGAVFQTTVQTANNTEELQIRVAAAQSPPATTTKVYLSGIEVIQRQSQ